MPILLETEKKFRDQGFAVIGISFDRSREAMDAYVKAQGMPWPQLFGGQTEQGQAGEAFFITGIPTMFLIDKTGKVREIGHIGPTLADSVKKLLDEPEAK